MCGKDYGNKETRLDGDGRPDKKEKGKRCSTIEINKAYYWG
jgi:hypothetical protein